MKQTKTVHKKSASTTWSNRHMRNRIYFHESNNYGNNENLNKQPRHSEEVIIHENFQLKTYNKEIFQKGYEASYDEMI